MKISSSKKRVAAIGVVTAASLVGGGVAFAYWTTTGTGTGSASTGTNTAFGVTILPDAIDPGDAFLAPGTGEQYFTVKVTNPPAAGVQRLNNVVVSILDLDGLGAPIPWAPSGCSKADYQLNAASAGGSATLTPPANTDILPGASWEGSLTVKMVNTTDNQGGCKNLVVPLYAAAS